MTEQPEALRLAQELDAYHTRACHKEAAAELRRLHEEVESYGTIIQYHEASIARLTAVNQELLEALRVLSLALEEAPGRLTPKQRSVWEKSRDVLFSGGGWA